MTKSLSEKDSVARGGSRRGTRSCGSGKERATRKAGAPHDDGGVVELHRGDVGRSDAASGDGSRPVAGGFLRQAPRPASIINVVPLLLIRLYRWLLSPILGRFCRFTPTCSAYGEQCFMRFGFFKALALTAWRILRCQPLCKGGYDPPPEPDGYKFGNCRG